MAGLEGGISVTADAATNSLIIQASQEGFNTLAGVIEKLDVERPQVSVEALIMELTVNDSQDLGFSGLLRIIDGDERLRDRVGDLGGAAARWATPPRRLVAPADRARSSATRATSTPATDSAPATARVIDAIIDLSATNGDINIVSAPHILTSDNEEAEIRVGDNIPIISSRVESARAASTTPASRAR